MIEKKEFLKLIWNKNIKAFIVYVTFLLIIAIYAARKVQITLLLIEKFKISAKYLNFLDMFSEKKTLVLPKLTKLNQYIIKLHDDK